MGGKVTLITGTSTGIGFATALLLAEKGYNVFATMRDPGRGGGALETAAKKAGAKLNIAKLDVDDPASGERCINVVLAKEGRIDVLINNAGIGELGVVEDATDAFAKATFETNFFGPLRLTRAVLPGMRERRSGTIVNVSSVAGIISGMAQSIYCATKHALESISESLALEVREFGIRVAIIEPGIFKTPIIAKAIGAVAGHETSPYATSERRIAAIYAQGGEVGGEPETVAEAILHAIETDAPKLRYPVGIDAPVFLEGRRKISDEEWVEFGAPMTDDEFWALFAKTFPMPVE
jgi:NAD(P)-dependent dehydrogenase (short-subunit alcohol dehydrogenase family)